MVPDTCDWCGARACLALHGDVWLCMGCAFTPEGLLLRLELGEDAEPDD